MLSQIEQQQWAEKGYCVICGKFDQQDLLNARTFIYKNKGTDRADFGSELEFPYKNYELNHITLNKLLIKTVKQLLKTDEILLIQSTAWLKYGQNEKTSKQNLSSNNDQRMHMDFPNHNILVPSSFDRPDVVGVIIYLDNDHEYYNNIGGRTAIVPRNGPDDPLYQEQYSMAPGLSNIPWINDKIEAEKYFFKNNINLFKFRSELYKREIQIPYIIGSILFYRHDVYHRGTPIKEGKSRAVINLVFKRKELFHIHSWNKGPARSMYDHSCTDVGSFEKLIVSLDENQRSVLGFPLLSDNYWTIDNIIQVLLRYNFNKESVLYLDLLSLLKRKQNKNQFL